MNRKVWIAGVVLLGSVAALTTAIAQDQGKSEEAVSEKDMKAAMAEWMHLNRPSNNHMKLAPLVGSWNVKLKIFMAGPGAPPTVSEGSAEVKWILGKRFIEETFHGTMMDQPFEGRGVTGYDNNRNVYQMTWIDSMGTAIALATGVADHQQPGVFRFYGTMDEPMLDVYGRPYRTVTRVISKDKHVFEMYDLHIGENAKVMEFEYTRKK